MKHIAMIVMLFLASCAADDVPGLASLEQASLIGMPATVSITLTPPAGMHNANTGNRWPMQPVGQDPGGVSASYQLPIGTRMHLYAQVPRENGTCYPWWNGNDMICVWPDGQTWYWACPLTAEYGVDPIAASYTLDGWPPIPWWQFDAYFDWHEEWLETAKFVGPPVMQGWTGNTSVRLACAYEPRSVTTAWQWGFLTRYPFQ